MSRRKRSHSSASNPEAGSGCTGFGSVASSMRSCQRAQARVPAGPLGIGDGPGRATIARLRGIGGGMHRIMRAAAPSVVANVSAIARVALVCARLGQARTQHRPRA
jgi:hypothetical protein